MSFQKIDKDDSTSPEGRECILVYGFTSKAFTVLKAYCAMIGIRDLIEIKQDMIETTIEDLLEGKLVTGKAGENLADQALVFNAFSDQKLSAFIGNFSRSGLKQPLLATVTETSIKWPFKDLVAELQREREAIARGQENPEK